MVKVKGNVVEEEGYRVGVYLEFILIFRFLKILWIFNLQILKNSLDLSNCISLAKVVLY